MQLVGRFTSPVIVAILPVPTILASSLTIGVPLDIASGSITLTTTGSGNNIVLNAPVTTSASGTLTLTSAGSIYQANAGVIFEI